MDNVSQHRVQTGRICNTSYSPVKHMPRRSYKLPVRQFLSSSQCYAWLALPVRGGGTLHAIAGRQHCTKYRTPIASRSLKYGSDFPLLSFAWLGCNRPVARSVSVHVGAISHAPTGALACRHQSGFMVATSGLTHRKSHTLYH